ncbi:MAG: RelA/SpoT family protein [Candidatus Azobacteroides sp.]|nr:RelA/SpoT family protein [Candidatus Azobacteroides sp.]
MNKPNNTKEAEDLMIQKEYEALLDDYIHSNHRQRIERINKAFIFANQAHKGVKRRSGEPYIMHPLAVSRIVCKEMGLGSTSICSALLHDVVEDTDYTVEDIQNLFGERIAQIVDGLTKISGGIFVEAASLQAENMRKLLLTMSSDIRVVLIKMADRLHNMRTLGSLLPAKQYKIAGETMYLYAPLAHRLGLFAIKTELEDLSFRYEHPEEYKQITQKLKATASDRGLVYEHFAAPLRKKLDEMDMKYEMKERVKSVYSVWSKMQSKGVGFDDVYDIFAVRIVFESQEGIDEKKRCWDIYSVITDLYKLRPDRIRDWVSRPKANGYQALHLTVMGPDGQWIEIQIRSSKMDEIAEKGFAAHWKYKERQNPEDETELDKWLGTIQELLENPDPNAMDFLDTIKLNLYTNEIFIFTPRGDLKTLPQNATALDFAYELHTDIGDSCIGAKVNHKLVPLSHKLSSGDQVEILTSKSHHPQEEWLSFATTAKAKTKIEAALRKQKKEKIKNGEKKVMEILKKFNISPEIAVLDKITSYYGFSKKDDFYYAVLQDQITWPDNPKKILREKSDNIFLKYVKQTFNLGKSEEEKENVTPENSLHEVIDKTKTYILKEEGFHKNYIVANCCKPIPGDEVLGFLDEDNTVTAHKRSCSFAQKLKSNFGEKIISCEWGKNNLSSFPSTIEVDGIDSVGILNQITKTISEDFVVNIRKIQLDSNAGIFAGKIEISVHDVNDINQLCGKLSKIKGVKTVKRVDD